MTEVVGEYGWYKLALQGKAPPTSEAACESGFYRWRRKRGTAYTYHAVALWKDTHDGAQRCLVDGVDMSAERAAENWPWFSKEPITKAVYEWARAGKGWPDQHAAVERHNQAPVSDDFASIQDRIADLARDAKKLLEAGAAKSQDTADQASDLSNTFGELWNKADSLRKVEKEPHLEAGRQIDNKWRDLLASAAQLRDTLKRIVVTPFLVAKREATQKAAAAAIAQGTPAAEVAPPRIVAGSSKRSSALRTYKLAKIVDKEALLAHLKDHPALVECVQSIANAAAKNDITLPGCEITKEQRAA